MKKVDLSRREFLRAGAAVSAGAVLMSDKAFAAGSDKLRVAMIGCGDRGTKDAIDCLNADPGTEMVAIADMFQDRVDKSLAEMRKAVPDKVKVTPQTVFLGFDAYKKVLAMKDVDIVLLLTPPGFRPVTLRAALEAGKHIFMEKPGAVDPVGIRSLMESADLADQKKLSIVVGTQQRWQPHYQELMKRVHNGDLSARSSAGRPIGTGAAPSGTGRSASPAGRIWNGRSAAGPTSPGCRATTSSSSTCTTWT